MKFRKKPIVIEAFLWLGNAFQKDDPLWIIEAIGEGTVWFVNLGSPECKLCIGTREGIMQANIGDWIICGVKGEIYPCKPEIFDATYEVVEK